MSTVEIGSFKDSIGNEVCVEVKHHLGGVTVFHFIRTPNGKELPFMSSSSEAAISLAGLLADAWKYCQSLQ